MGKKPIQNDNRKISKINVTRNFSEIFNSIEVEYIFLCRIVFKGFILTKKCYADSLKTQIVLQESCYLPHQIPWHMATLWFFLVSGIFTDFSQWKMRIFFSCPLLTIPTHLSHPPCSQYADIIPGSKSLFHLHGYSLHILWIIVLFETIPVSPGVNIFLGFLIVH